MQDYFPRTLAAQRAAAADWLGVFAGEQLELHLRSARLAGTLSAVGEQWLRHCLPGLEACVEAQCSVELGIAAKGELDTHYGFPQTGGYPVVVSGMGLSPELQSPRLAALSGTIRRWKSRSPSHPPGAAEWWQVIAATQAEDWPAAKRALEAIVGGKGGAALAAQFATNPDPTRQLVVAVVVAGSPQESSGLISVLGLPSIAVRADALQIA